MSTLVDFIKGVGKAVGLNERLDVLANRVDQLEARDRSTGERLARLEMFVELTRDRPIRSLPRDGRLRQDP